MTYKEKHSLLFVFPFEFEINEKKLIIRYFWIFKYEIPFSNIVDFETIENIPWYVYGIRVDPIRRSLAFILNHKKAIRIKKKNGFWKEIIISVDKQEKFYYYLKQTNIKNKQ